MRRKRAPLPPKNNDFSQSDALLLWRASIAASTVEPKLRRGEVKGLREESALRDMSFIVSFSVLGRVGPPA